MNLFQLILRMIHHIFRRGHGILKLLFVIDDFFRIFTMTILIPIFFNWLKLGQIIISLGLLLGLVIDMHDFIAEMGIGKAK